LRRVKRGPNSDNPSFVLVEWMDAWLSFSNTCSELTAKGRHERLYEKKTIKSYNKASALICMVLSLHDARGMRVTAQNEKHCWLTGTKSLSHGCLGLSGLQVLNRPVLSL
jgi:5-methylthioribose kinase